MAVSHRSDRTRRRFRLLSASRMKLTSAANLIVLLSGPWALHCLVSRPAVVPAAEAAVAITAACDGMLPPRPAGVAARDGTMQQPRVVCGQLGAVIGCLPAAALSAICGARASRSIPKPGESALTSPIKKLLPTPERIDEQVMRWNDTFSRVLFDFRHAHDLDDWEEFSDSRRLAGKSKAALTLLRTGGTQRGVLFTLLNPQPSGACFAGMRLRLNETDLSEFLGIKIRGRAQGEHGRLKITLRSPPTRAHPQMSFELYRVLPADGDTVVDALYPFSQFQPFARGVGPLWGMGQLDRSRVTDVTLSAFGGVNVGSRVRGVASFELEWIAAYRSHPVKFKEATAAPAAKEAPSLAV